MIREASLFRGQGGGVVIAGELLLLKALYCDFANDAYVYMTQKIKIIKKSKNF